MSAFNVPGYLGCPQSYACVIYPRGGRGRAVGVLEGTTSIQWDRKLNGVGAASVSMAAGQVSGACCRLMDLLAQDKSTRAYELHIYRDSDKVWCGPIMKLSETRGPNQQSFTMTARDTLAYLDDYGHWLQAGYTFTGDLVTIAEEIIGSDVLTDDPGIGANVVATPSGISTTQAAARASNSVLGEINKLGPLGLRYTTAVRTIYLGGVTGTPFGPPIHLSVDEIAGDVTITHDGSLYANTIYGGSGTATAQIPVGTIPPDDPQAVTIGAPEPGWRGRVEHGVTATGGTSGRSAVVAVAQAAYYGARRPRTIKVADDSAISQKAAVTVAQLIPGTVVKLAGRERFCTWISQDLQIVRVTGTYTSDGERIGISMGQVG